MTLKLNLNVADRHAEPSRDPNTALAEAISEKNRFLHDNPDLKPFQVEIDTLLDKAGNSQNRMAVLAMLMEGKLIELNQKLNSLNRILMEAVQH